MKSKVDLINEVFDRRVRMAIESRAAELVLGGNTVAAQVLLANENHIKLRTIVSCTYDRLELDDIIKGHKRAWPE